MLPFYLKNLKTESIVSNTPLEIYIQHLNSVVSRGVSITCNLSRQEWNKVLINKATVICQLQLLLCFKGFQRKSAINKTTLNMISASTCEVSCEHLDTDWRNVWYNTRDRVFLKEIHVKKAEVFLKSFLSVIKWDMEWFEVWEVRRNYWS